MHDLSIVLTSPESVLFDVFETAVFHMTVKKKKVRIP